MSIRGNQNRTIVLAHGAWHGAWCWAATQAELDRRGLHSLAVDNPGHGASTLPPTDLIGEAAQLRQVLANIPGEIVLVGHSYGGVVMTEAAIGSPNVVHLVYLAAYCLDAGEKRSALKDRVPTEKTALDAARSTDASGVTTVHPVGALDAFYECCEPAAAQAAVARLCPQNVSQQVLTEATWRRIPSTYVICERDRAIHPKVQEFMATRCGTVVRLDTDHSPFLSRPRETADVLEPLARRRT
jgi:pimeloyl-ACP methyl ester carboxylesterase